MKAPNVSEPKMVKVFENSTVHAIRATANPIASQFLSLKANVKIKLYATHTYSFHLE